MDAVEFLKTSYRMCNTYEDCNACPVDTYACYIHGGNCRENPDGVVAVVEQWAQDHPFKTRQSEFLKMFPNAVIENDGILHISPCNIDKEIECVCVNEESCDDCRREYWLSEVTNND